jgi:riboflavin kinase/FMN adenylyltransferase
MTTRTVLSIGNFDGVHIGHAALIRRARELAGDARVLALTFDPHPFSKLKPAAVPDRLTRFGQREALLLQAGADEVVRLRPDDTTLGWSATEFADWLVSTFNPVHIVEGSDFHFGKGRGGNVRTLADYGNALAADMRFSVDVVQPVQVALDDQLVVTASSSITRWLVARGRVWDAASVLGRRHEVDGTVTRGDQRGRTIGFPTANLQQDGDEVLLPADGVYAAFATLPDGSECPSAVNIGTRPTFNGVERRVEAIVLDDDGAAVRKLPIGEYGWHLKLSFVSWLRDQVRFSGIEALCAQLSRDTLRAGNAVTAGRNSTSHLNNIGVLA